MKIVLGQTGWIDSVADLYERHMRPNYIVMTPKFYEWQFRKNPYLKESGLEDGSVMAVEGSEVYAHLGLITVPFRVGDQTVMGVYLSNWLTHPQYRGLGLGQMLLSRVRNRFPVVAGMSLSGDARSIYSATGFRYIHQLPRWLGIIDADATYNLLDTRRKDGTLAVLRRRQLPPGSIGPLVQKIQGPLGPPCDLLWERLEREQLISSVRTAQYLNWRYVSHPFFDYQVLAVVNGTAWTGLGIYRVQQVRDRKERVLHILEFLALPEAQVTLAQALLSCGVDQGCAFVDFLGLSENPVRGLVAAGIFREDEEPELRVPFRFQPLDHRVTATNWACWSEINRLDGTPLTSSFHDWYISQGDCDRDRPN